MRIALLFAAVALASCSSSDPIEGTGACAAAPLAGTWSLVDNFESSTGDCTTIQSALDKGFFLGSATADPAKATWIEGDQKTVFAIASASSCSFLATHTLASANGQTLLESRTYDLDNSPDHKTVLGTLTFKVFAAGADPTTATPVCTADFLSSAIRE